MGENCYAPAVAWAAKEGVKPVAQMKAERKKENEEAPRFKNEARRLTDDEILAKRAEFLKEKAAREAYRRSRPFAAADPPIDLRECPVPLTGQEAYRREQASQAPAVAAPAAAEDEDEDSDDAPLESLITVRRRDDSSDDD